MRTHLHVQPFTQSLSVQMAPGNFRLVARQATEELNAFEQRAKEVRVCEPYATWRCATLVVLMMCFVASTPLSLSLTLPAYVLADRVSAANACTV